MDQHLKHYQLVIIDSPFDIWDNILVQVTFAKMVSLKKAGYGSCYARGVLPVDTSDFFSTHVLLCEADEDGTYNPIMGYKTVTLERCRQFNQNFPGLSLVQNAKAPQHVEVVQSIIAKCDAENKQLAYLGSWTVNPTFKKRMQGKINLKEAFSAFYSFLYKEQNVSDVVIGGTLRFKTEKLFAELGHLPLSLNGQTLSPIYVAHLVKEPVLVMHADGIPDQPSLAQKKWQNIWEDRIVLNGTTEHKLKSVV